MANPFLANLISEPVSSVHFGPEEQVPEQLHSIYWFIHSTLQSLGLDELPVRVLAAYWLYLESQGYDKLQALPRGLQADFYPFFDLDLGAVRYVEGVDTLIAQKAVTIGYRLFFPRKLDLTLTGDVDWLMHELRHSQQFVSAGGITEYFKKYLEAVSQQLRTHRVFNVHILPSLEADATAHVTKVRENLSLLIRPPECGYLVSNGDALYDNYRRGLITRHLCLNGRIEEKIWLQQRIISTDATSRLSYNSRCREELYETVKGNRLGPTMIAWYPLSRDLFEMPQDEVIPTSYASGENALMATGLALAAFSLEALSSSPQENTTRNHSLEYARRIFNFLLASEIPGKGGSFLRIESPHPKHQPFLASLDDTLGICVGIRYYLEATRDDSAEQERIVSLVRRMGNLFGSHGYWIVPWSDVYYRNSKVGDSWFFRHPGDDKSVTRSQLGWVFGYAFRLFFRHVTGENYTAEWEGTEKSAYTKSLFPGDASILGWQNSLIVELIDPLHTTTPTFYRWMCHFLAERARPSQETDPINFVQWLARQDSPDLEEIKKYIHDSVIGALGEIGDKLRAFLFDVIAEDNFFNFTLFGLATILVAECGGDLKAVAQAGKLFEYLLEKDYGHGNGFFAAVMRACRVANGDTTSTSQADLALRYLVTPPKVGTSEAFEPDLSLHQFDKLEAIMGLPYGSPEAQTISGAVDVAEDEWRRALEETDIPISFNLDCQWGGWMTWQSLSWDRAVGGIIEGGTDITEIARALLSQPKLLSITQEDCGVGFLFARLLATRFGALPVPVFQGVRWATLPFLGAAPFRLVGNQKSREVHNATLLVPECRMHLMAKHHVVIFSSFQQAKEQGYDNCAYCLGNSARERLL